MVEADNWSVAMWTTGASNNMSQPAQS